MNIVGETHPASKLSLGIRLALLSLASVLAPPAQGLEPREVFKLAESSVVIVLAADSKTGKNVQGSGVFIAPQEILTSCKVVDGAADIVVSRGGDLKPAKVRYADRERDLCQLHIDKPMATATPARMEGSGGTPEVGEDLYLVSSPRGLNNAMNRVMVSGLQSVPGTAASVVQLDAAHEAGSLGGGLFDAQGRLVGILSTKLHTPGTAVAIPAEWTADLPGRVEDVIQAGGKDKGTGESSSRADAKAPELPAWLPRPGDRWKYRLSHNKGQVGVVTIEVTDVAENLVRERISFDRSRAFRQERAVDTGRASMRFQPLVLLPGSYQLPEINPYLPAGTPLEAGKRWRDVPGDFSIQGSSRSLVADVRVLGREKVRVPAGEFDAGKIEAVTNRVQWSGIAYWVRCVYWHAPDMKRPVRVDVFTDSSHPGYTSMETYELTSFEAAK